MNQSHYPSLELCKRLTENNFPRFSIYRNSYGVYNKRIEGFEIVEDNDYVCPSIAELLDELPKEEIIIRWNYPDWRVIIESKDHGTRDEFLPNALAEMWLYLKENNLITKK